MMGIVNSYNSLGRIFGPLAGGVLFDTLGYQSPFVAGALIFFITFMLSFPLFRRDQAMQELDKAAETCV